MRTTVVGREGTLAIALLALSACRDRSNKHDHVPAASLSTTTTPVVTPPLPATQRPYLAYWILAKKPGSDTYKSLLQTLERDGIAATELSVTAPIPAGAELIVYIGDAPNPDLAKRLVAHLRGGGVVLANLEREALVEELREPLGIHLRSENFLPLNAGGTAEAPVLASAWFRTQFEFVLDSPVAMQIEPGKGPSLTAGIADVVLDSNGNGRQDRGEDIETVLVGSQHDLVGTGAVWLVSDSRVFSDALIAQHSGNLEYLRTANAWLIQSIENRRRLAQEADSIIPLHEAR